jgi:hypothetical protein
MGALLQLFRCAQPAYFAQRPGQRGQSARAAFGFGTLLRFDAMSADDDLDLCEFAFDGPRHPFDQRSAGRFRRIGNPVDRGATNPGEFLFGNNVIVRDHRIGVADTKLGRLFRPGAGCHRSLALSVIPHAESPRCRRCRPDTRFGFGRRDRLRIGNRLRDALADSDDPLFQGRSSDSLFCTPLFYR